MSANSSLAQIIPDSTLPNNSHVKLNGNTFTITGGTQAGRNLFHSFKEFSVPTGSTAAFNNSQNIQNILTRVTGGSVSNIDGLIKTNGTANLFVINPNGIIFGQNAKLDIGGSFIASTASSLKFSDGFEFSATKPVSTPLLTINVPIGLQFKGNSGNIVAYGTGYDLSVQAPLFSAVTVGNNSTGLQVPSGKTLALVGGNVDLQGSMLTAAQGRIELGSVGDGEVSLNPISSGFVLSYQNVQNLRDIRLSQKALAGVSGGGSIQVQGNNISLTDGSLILMQNQGDEFGGSISANATESLRVSGTNLDGSLNGGLRSETAGSGRGSGANIAIATKQLIVEDGAGIITRSFSPAKAGNLTVNASDFVEVIGVAPVRPTVISSISAMTFNSGDAGDVTLSTKRLTIRNGAAIASATLGAGSGGQVTLNALDSIELIGMSSILAPSVVNALTTSTGDAGKVIIDTNSLMLRAGGTVSSATFGPANAGSLIINAKEFVEVSGAVLNSPRPSSVESAAPILSETLQRFYRLPPIPSGFSGDVTINTKALRVTDSATVEVSNQGLGNAGRLRVQANSIFLDRGGAITAATESGEGGNIELQIQDLLLLRRNSEITASAKGSGNGGNITINSPLIANIPTENSDITANSINARGGNVNINTSGIFGIQFRTRNTPLSDITATGKNSSLNGTVEINIQDVSPTSGLLNLPEIPLDVTRLIAQACIANKGSSFTVTGRGGLPPNPTEVLTSDNFQVDWINRDSQQYNSAIGQERNTIEDIQNVNFPLQIVEAQSWFVDPNGDVILVAQAATANPHSPLFNTTSCSRG
ncbi:MAG: filamentous hemagglutinin N-terminal domain-containing protein [Aulosira sp. ZfuVER01]|nr:filamentous hemagglutinin N-terminal domain-containing protein [Aulosira sp. ZfuVER01]MDZ7997908.1 filamentous hemagglutinin N-terminal domain-containing protein [Aulosira sp. DedVER01a]MDZ8054701.1 filamentous hemagglutinin N-terminal domain-containing protein [Aulosira sp. ZfuCHP01]